MPLSVLLPVVVVGLVLVIGASWWSTDEPCRYGLVHDLATFNPVRIALHEALTMFGDVLTPGLTLRQRWLYLWGPPGWRHDGQDWTTEAIRARQIATAPTTEPG